MKELASFNIPFIGLSQGKHNFLFKINESFFKHFEASLIQQCNVNVDLTFEKKERLFILDFDIKGKVNVPCDRCLEYFELPIKGMYRMYVKFEDSETKRSEDEEDVMYIFSNETHLEVSHLIYEYINLCLPMQIAHPDGQCNPAILKFLKEEAQEDSSRKDENDPRWDALKKLKKPSGRKAAPKKD